MDNSPRPWYKMKDKAEMERLEAVLNLRKSGYATGTTAGDGRWRMFVKDFDQIMQRGNWLNAVLYSRDAVLVIYLNEDVSFRAVFE